MKNFDDVIMLILLSFIIKFNSSVDINLQKKYKCEYLFLRVMIPFKIQNNFILQ